MIKQKPITAEKYDKKIKYCKHSNHYGEINFRCDFRYYALYGRRCSDSFWFWHCEFNKDKTALALRKLKGEE